MPEAKTCFKCGAEKPLTDFYKHPQMSDGRVNKCTECSKADVRKNRANRVDYYRAFDAKRYQDDPRVKARHKLYQKTENGRAAVAASKKRWAERNPEKRAAQVMVGNSIRDGKLIKGPCEICGSEKVHAHHDDYSKPLDVRWLCPQHHSDLHKNR